MADFIVFMVDSVRPLFGLEKKYSLFISLSEEKWLMTNNFVSAVDIMPTGKDPDGDPQCCYAIGRVVSEMSRVETLVNQENERKEQWGRAGFPSVFLYSIFL